MKQVILGSTGAIGTALAKELSHYSTDLTLVSRNPERVNPNDKLISADLTSKENIEKSILGADIVYVTIGFPYKTSLWQKHWIPFMETVVENCIQNQSKLVFFDNIYAIGAKGVHHITEESPFCPSSKKGAIRAKINHLILKQMETGKLKALIARAPDFFGGKSGKNSLLTTLVFDRLKKGKKAQWFCSADKIHSFGYVPDLAKGTALLGNTKSAFNQVWNLPTDPQKLTGRDWIDLFAEELGCEPRFSIIPNWALKSLGVVVPIMWELAEMNYQFDRDYFFDSKKFNDFFDYKPMTPQNAVKEFVKSHKF